MWTRAFWRSTAERALKTLAQFLLVLLGSDLATTAVYADTVNVFTVNWLYVLGCALGGALLSVLMSVASAAITGDDTPSLVAKGRHARPE